MRVIRVLPLADWLALLTFFTGWIGYVRFAKARAQAIFISSLMARA